MSHPAYPNAVPVRAIMARLAEASASNFHEFWPDDISLLDSKVANCALIHRPRQITDVHLVALAVRHGGQFVTLDATVARDGVIGAGKGHILVL